MTVLCRLYVEEQLGTKYTEKLDIPFEKSYEETGPETPVFFVLSPGVDPLKDVEALGKKLGFSTDAQNFHNVSLGQGQEIVAENALDVAAQEGHWVILQVGRRITFMHAYRGHPSKAWTLWFRLEGVHCNYACHGSMLFDIVACLNKVFLHGVLLEGP